MKYGWILTAAILLAACGQPKDVPQESDIVAVEDHEMAQPGSLSETPQASDYVAPDFAKLSGYGEGWYISPGWPGEYPAGFVVLDESISVMGRAKPNPASPQDKACTLPQLANYQLWNNPRVSSDELEFFVATKTFPVTLNQDAQIEYISDAGSMQTLDLKQGEQLNYLRYLGEGFAILSYAGTEYDINEAELMDITDIQSTKGQEDEWLRVTCSDGSKVWLLYDEVVTVPGIVPSPITGYGDASDITLDQVEGIRAEAEQNAALAESLGEAPIE
ncbi:hypothetical protein [Hyphomonas oceanitis]|uniref:Putative lipoprotein n=1 Tax=Hyphomonas oceanitis SCH89 TaxID=1280953 RepID=A0A059GCN4_9PROT|nr:hypothetical protein [Hyphomonas oceanitis]KDA04258.1 putative lipoprotein [Hyphomonas oceanitis SCH89]